MNNLRKKSGHMLKALMPAKVIQAQMHRRIFMQFAEKVGFVYFGYVDQRSDEHRLIRGLTVSSNHRDTNYCIGTYEGYDIALVERVDTIKFPGKPTKRHDWIIMTFDLRTSYDIPHIFLGLHTHSDTFYAHLFTKFSHLAQIPLGNTIPYDKGFLSRYVLYASPDQSLTAKQLFDPTLAKTIADHFGSLTVEVVDGTVYVYAEHQRPSQQLLEKMLKYGLWLTRTIDYKLQSSHEVTV